MVDLSPRRFDGGPEADALRRWVQEGLTNEQIAQRVGEMFGTTPPSRQGVTYWLHKHGIRRDTNRAATLDHSEVRPWRVKMEHTGDGIEHRLYDYSRRRQGRMLKPGAERLLDEFLEFLREKDWVVDYDPSTENGWLFRPRDPELDDPDNIIRSPRAGVTEGEVLTLRSGL